MLDQLDDPVPFTVSPDLVAAAKSRGTHLRRRHRVAVTGAMVPVILVLALVAGAVYVDHRLDQVDRVDVAAGVLAPVVAGQPFNVLVVGTDENGGHSDAILLVHVTGRGTASMLSRYHETWSSTMPPARPIDSAPSCRTVVRAP